MTLSKSAVFWLTVLVLVLFVFAIKFGDFVNSHYYQALKENPLFDQVKTVLIPVTAKNEAITFVGDVMLARDVENKLKLQPTAYPFEGIKSLLNSRFVIGNFEGSIPKTHIPTKNLEMKFSVSPDLLDVLNAGGFTHMSLANNHSYDYGVTGYVNTVKNLESLGLFAFGNPTSISTSSISYISLANKKVAIIAINATYGYPTETIWSNVVNEAIKHSAFQIVYIHWGNEYDLTHSRAQEYLAHGLINAGIDIIIGHHPHVVQDIEKYKNGLILYSLGNFIFDQYFSQDVQEGLVVKLTLDTDFARLLLFPIESKSVRVQPHEIAGNDRQVFLEALASRSSSVLKDDILSETLALQF